jgi:hypothetical protein
MKRADRRTVKACIERHNTVVYSQLLKEASGCPGVDRVSATVKKHERFAASLHCVVDFHVRSIEEPINDAILPKGDGRNRQPHEHCEAPAP